MTDYTFSSLDLNGTLKVPATAEEYDKLAARENAAVDAAVDYTVFHKVLTAFRDDMMKAVYEATKVEPKKTKTEKGAEVWDEKPAIYVARAAAETGKEVSDFQPLADKWAADFDFKTFLIVRERKAPVPAKRDLEMAVAILADPARLSRTITKFNELNVKCEDPNDKTKLAFAIGDFRAALAKNALA